MTELIICILVCWFIWPYFQGLMEAFKEDKAQSTIPHANNNHESAFGHDYDGYKADVLYCHKCDMAAHMYTIGGEECPVCGGDTVERDGVWHKKSQRWRLK